MISPAFSYNFHLRSIRIKYEPLKTLLIKKKSDFFHLKINHFNIYFYTLKHFFSLRVKEVLPSLFGL